MTGRKILDQEIRLSVVVPVFNERDNVKPLIEEIGKALTGLYNFEIVYVDDGSDDGTADCIAAVARTASSDVRCIRHESRRGQSGALISGIRAATGNWIVTLDGNGQNDPADIPAMIDVLVAAHPERPGVE